MQVLNQLNEELDKEQSASGVDLTVAAVLEVIKKVAKNFKKDRFRVCVLSIFVVAILILYKAIESSLITLSGEF